MLTVAVYNPQAINPHSDLDRRESGAPGSGTARGYNPTTAFHADRAPPAEGLEFHRRGTPISDGVLPGGGDRGRPCQGGAWCDRCKLRCLIFQKLFYATLRRPPRTRARGQPLGRGAGMCSGNRHHSPLFFGYVSTSQPFATASSTAV